LTNGTHVFSTNFYLAKRLQKTKTVYWGTYNVCDTTDIFFRMLR
jgi:hypothetical protein